MSAALAMFLGFINGFDRFSGVVDGDIDATERGFNVATAALKSSLSLEIKVHR